MEPFSFLHFGELLAAQFAAMYRGGDRAWKILEGERERHRRAFVLKAGLGKAVLSVQRAQAALGAHGAAGAGPLAIKCLAAARTESRALCRSKVRYALLYSPLIEAQLAAFAGETERARALTRVAAGEVTRPGYGLLEAPITYLEGLLEAGDAGRTKGAQALALAAGQGGQNPRRFVAMDCPVIDWLAAKWPYTNGPIASRRAISSPQLCTRSRAPSRAGAAAARRARVEGGVRNCSGGAARRRGA